jgi:glutamate synthase domain-containing protein 2
VLDEGGQYKWRKNSEYHMYNPETVHLLQFASKTMIISFIKIMPDELDEQHGSTSDLRHLLEFD